MILTTRGRYAVMSVIDVVMNGKDSRPVSLSSISSRQGISLSYLEQIFLKLRKNGIVKSIKGPGGGYILAGNSSSISAADIMDAIGEPIKMERCEEGSRSCMSNGSGKCKTHYLWKGLGRRIRDYLSSISIDDICNDNIDKMLPGMLPEMDSVSKNLS